MRCCCLDRVVNASCSFCFLLLLSRLSSLVSATKETRRAGAKRHASYPRIWNCVSKSRYASSSSSSSSSSRRRRRRLKRRHHSCDHSKKKRGDHQTVVVVCRRREAFGRSRRDVLWSSLFSKKSFGRRRPLLVIIKERSADSFFRFFSFL